MIPVVRENINALQEVCRNLAVGQLYLFGSAARESDFNDSSDIDFLFRFESDAEHLKTDKKPDYLDLLFQLENVLKRKVDLVWIDGITNPYFIQSVKRI
ncbi:nucleotidyltransferase domain-containing protein [Niabella sp. W65]|nr:nucleotidyltransferase domain-containing protein [Niabella sp. W65]MCH7366511.1 nucleotidyltransferase domain-containing protein [Niabella sp. W65]ULT42225.1 nucleotidyltransferase domain-containing protein [Niabella sp. I65]